MYIYIYITRGHPPHPPNGNGPPAPLWSWMGGRRLRPRLWCGWGGWLNERYALIELILREEIVNHEVMKADH